MGYAPGSERVAQDEMDKQLSEVIEIPCVIDGELIFTGNTVTQVVPHDHGQVLANVHLAGSDEMEAACRAAADAQSSWIQLGLEERCAIFERCADLLAGEWRMRVNASTMLNQSKTAFRGDTRMRADRLRDSTATTPGASMTTTALVLCRE